MCGWVEDDLIEFVANETFPEVEGGIEDGAIYTVDVINISRDYESGIVDSWDLIFRKVGD